VRNSILQDILKGFQDCIWEYEKPKYTAQQNEGEEKDQIVNPSLLKSVDFLAKVKVMMLTHLPKSTFQLLRDRLVQLIEEESASNHKILEKDLQDLIESLAI
jgi:hypothetical protein